MILCMGLPRVKYVKHVLNKVFIPSFIYTERENLILTRHQVCSAHCEGGRKSYVNNVATKFAVFAFELLLLI